MAAIGIALVWAGYAAVFTGYVLFKDYDLNMKQIFSPNWPPPKLEKVAKRLTPSSTNVNANINPISFTVPKPTSPPQVR